MPAYLDCAATSPLDPRVRAIVLHYLDEEFGNAGSRTHGYGTRARRAVEQARHQIAEAVQASRGDVIFTSGATESNNLAILGLAEALDRSGRRHIVTSAIEHHAVLEPVRALERRGFRVTIVEPEAGVEPGTGGWVSAQAVLDAVGPDTGLVSVMHVNNETGVMQPVDAIASALGEPALGEQPVFLHVDAAQGFGRDLAPLRHPRIDAISISGHKIGAPKGVGALIARRRGAARPPLTPLMHGGGQERGLRPGTVPVHLVAGLGLAATLAVAEHVARREACLRLRDDLLRGLAPLEPMVNGDLARSWPGIVNLSIPGVDADEAIEAWSDFVAISDGAACTTQSYTCSHVLGAMRVDAPRAAGALRFSFAHDSVLPDLPLLVLSMRQMLAAKGRREEARVE